MTLQPQNEPVEVFIWCHFWEISWFYCQALWHRSGFLKDQCHPMHARAKELTQVKKSTKTAGLHQMLHLQPRWCQAQLLTNQENMPFCLPKA